MKVHRLDPCVTPRPRARGRWRVLPLALLTAAAAHAHLLENTPDVASQTTVLVEVGRHNACGMQFTSLDAPHGESGHPHVVWDLNLSVARGARPGLLTGVQKTELARIETQGGPRKPLKVLEAWFLQEGTPIAKPAGAVTASADGRAVLTPYDGGVVLKALADAANGLTPSFLLGIQLAEESTTRIYRFTPAISAADAKEFLVCAGALLSQELARKSPGR